MSSPGFADLTAHLLIAMPDMGDPRFAQSVILVCEHSDAGAMGIILNRPMPDLTLTEILKQLDLEGPHATPDLPVCYGGPVEAQRGFLLHPAAYRGQQDEAHDIAGRYALSATVDVMEDLARGTGPDRALFALGYSGWGPGQLEAEIAANGWLTVAATDALVFDTALEARWAAALAVLGADPVSLSSAAGTA